MLVSRIKQIFFSKFDAFQSSYINNSKLNDFFFEAQAEVWKDLMSAYEINLRNTSDAVSLVRNETITPTSNIVNLTTDLAEPFNTIINVYPKYTTSRGVTQYPAKPFFQEEKLSVYAKGTIRYPRFDTFTNSSSEVQLRLYPEEITPTEVTVMYFRNPITIDFNSPTDEIGYTDNTVNIIVDKAIQLASAATRDNESFQQSSILITQANTVQ